MPVMEISITPVGTPSTSYSSYVAAACQVPARRGLKHYVTPMSTVVEGDVSTLWEVAREMHQATFAGGANRVVTNVTIDDRKDAFDSMEKRVEAVVNPQSVGRIAGQTQAYQPHVSGYESWQPLQGQPAGSTPNSPQDRGYAGTPPYGTPTYGAGYAGTPPYGTPPYGAGTTRTSPGWPPF